MYPSSELRERTLRYIEAIATGDSRTLDNLIAGERDVLVIGTDPNEWWADRDTAYHAFDTQMAEMGGGFPIVASDPVAFEEGSVGWAADRPRLRMPDGSEAPFRLTLVFHRENDGWKVVQSHASLGVRNEEALGQELTI